MTWVSFIVVLSSVLASASPLSSYVNECEKAGIAIPDSVDCTKGEELPVFKSSCDNEGNILSHTRITPENFESQINYGQCDSPALVQKGNLRVGCMPGARIQLLPDTKGESVCAVICRRTHAGAPQNTFQDVSMICHRPETGATCFFNSKVDLQSKKIQKISHLPRPGSKEDKVWMAPNELNQARCVNCHDSQPFLVTPNLGDFGKTLRKRAETPLKGNYFVVGTSAPFNEPRWKNRLHLNETNRCTRCHRIGSGSDGGCGYLREAAVGKNPNQPPHSCGYHKGWMPPKGHGSLDKYQEDLKHIRECCEDITADGELKPSHKCQWEKIATDK